MLSIWLSFVSHYQNKISFLTYWFEREEGKEEGREKERIVGPLIYAFIGWFLYVPWPGIELATLVYGEGTLTNWATQTGPAMLFLKMVKMGSDWVAQLVRVSS